MRKNLYEICHELLPTTPIIVVLDKTKRVRFIGTAMQVVDEEWQYEKRLLTCQGRNMLVTKTINFGPMGKIYYVDEAHLAFTHAGG